MPKLNEGLRLKQKKQMSEYIFNARMSEAATPKRVTLYDIVVRDTGVVVEKGVPLESLTSRGEKARLYQAVPV